MTTRGPERIRSVAVSVTVEIERLRGSRFVAELAPAASPEAAAAVVEAARQRWPDASHHCWAWRLADGAGRSSDDGEPRGTAGAPILRHLTGADLVDVVAVVTRWFGGTKLGRGGLLRAYGAAAAAAIEAAAIVERPVLTSLLVEHDYEFAGPVRSVIAAHDVRVVDADYGATTRLVLRVPAANVAAFGDDLRDSTAGRVVARPR